MQLQRYSKVKTWMTTHIPYLYGCTNLNQNQFILWLKEVDLLLP